MSEASAPEFAPTEPAFHVAAEGPRDIGIVIVGDSLVAGVGDPKGQGWVTRVIGRSQIPGAVLRAYNLGIEGDSSGDVLHRWEAEATPRWRTVSEKRLVISVGTNDVVQGISLARQRLNLANILDDCTGRGIATFVVGPPPPADPRLREQVKVVADAQLDVCDRRLVPYVDTFTPLVGHEQWESDVASGDGIHPGSAGYGLMAWLVLHHGWDRWLEATPVA